MHTVSESTAMSFIPRQYSWAYTCMNMSEENNMLQLLHSFSQTILSKGQLNLWYSDVFSKFYTVVYVICNPVSET